MDANVTDYSKLWQIHGALHDLATDTGFVISGADAFIGFIDLFDASKTEATRAAYYGNFKALSLKVDELSEDGRLGMAVRTQEISANQWLAISQTVWDALVSLQKDAGRTAFRWADVWGEVIVPTAVTVKNGVVQGAETVVNTDYTFLIVVIVIGLASLAVIKVA